MYNNQYSMAHSSRDFMYKVYGWMSTGLMVTAAVAYGIGSSQEMALTLMKNPVLVFGLFILQIGAVMFLRLRIQKLSYTEAAAVFLTYSALSGATLSSIFLIYTLSSIGSCFLIAAGMFSAMALYGYFTKSDLSSLGSFLLMGLWGIILAGLVNMWFRNSMMQMYISIAAVGIFTLLTAYDTQKIKRIGESMMADPETRSKIAVLGALTLYLDLINLFLYLLQLFGKRRD